MTEHTQKNKGALTSTALSPTTLTPKERMALPAQAMPEQDPRARVRNVREVACGYDEAQARAEAERCLNCPKKPCVDGCPAAIQIPEFITHVQKGRYEEALAVIFETNVLPAVCGRVCPQKEQCQTHCVYTKKHGGDPRYAVGIGNLERFVADWSREHKKNIKPVAASPSGKRVAVIGSGPAGLTCAGDLAKLGHQVVIFEALHQPGGVLVYGIPEFRLPKDIVAYEIDMLKAMGVELRPNHLIGSISSLEELLSPEGGFSAVFVGSGAGLPLFLNVPGENLVGVYSANEYLTRVNLMKAYEADAETPVIRGNPVLVFGGGNVAMDSARTALRLGAADTRIVYRRTEKEMPARFEEIGHAKEEGVVFEELTAPLEILGDARGWVRGVKCQRMKLGAPDASGRPRPVPIPDSEFELAAEVVVVAIGNLPNPLIPRVTPDLQTNKKGALVVNPETLETTMRGVFAGGDISSGASTVIAAIRDGRVAAHHMHEYLIK